MIFWWKITIWRLNFCIIFAKNHWILINLFYISLSLTYIVRFFRKKTSFLTYLDHADFNEPSHDHFTQLFVYFLSIWKKMCPQITKNHRFFGPLICNEIYIYIYIYIYYYYTKYAGIFIYVCRSFHRTFLGAKWGAESRWR